MLLLDLIKKECQPYGYRVIHSSEQVNVLYIRAKNAVVCQLNADIKFEVFKEAILTMGEFIKTQKVANLVIDKRNMVTLHLPSMQWFYIDWMPHMYHHGVHTLHKILPNNALFKFSLQVGKDKIIAQNPQFAQNQAKIFHYNNLQEALDGF